MAQPVVDLLAERFQAESATFEVRHFVASVMSELPALELKDRINLIASELRRHLDEDYPTALNDVVAVAESGVDGFAAWPLCSFVEIFGVNNPDESLAAMEQLTQRMSCEFAIRPFLEHHLDRTVEQLEHWTTHPEPTVRRLVSEGTRPRLPWGPRVAVLSKDPAIGLALLERLRFDQSEDVRRSVANHLNDVAKDHPQLVVETSARWMSDGVDRLLISHALRTLVKQGNPEAFRVLGFTTNPSVQVSFAVEPSILELGGSIELMAEVTSTGTGTQHLVADFVIHHPTASGATSTKVFKWKTFEIGPGATVHLTKRRRIQDQSTRTYEPGWHAVELQIGGTTLVESGFELQR